MKIRLDEQYRDYINRFTSTISVPNAMAEGQSLRHGSGAPDSTGLTQLEERLTANLRFLRDDFRSLDGTLNQQLADISNRLDTFDTRLDNHEEMPNAIQPPGLGQMPHTPHQLQQMAIDPSAQQDPWKSATRAVTKAQLIADQARSSSLRAFDQDITSDFDHDMYYLKRSLGSSRGIQSGDGKPQWKISRKHPDALTKLIGNSSEHMYWRERMTDHTSHDWMTWRHVHDVALKSNKPISLGQSQNLDFGNGVAGQDLAIDLWNSTSKWIGHTVYERRTSMVNQDNSNCVELLRKLVVDHEGNDLLVQMAGQQNLTTFPKCHSINDLANVLEQRQGHVHRFGADLPDRQLNIMLTNIRPSEIHKELLSRPELLHGHYGGVIDWVNVRRVYMPHETLAQQLLTAGHIYKIGSGAELPPQPLHPRPRKVKETVGAVGDASRKLRPPVPLE